MDFSVQPNYKGYWHSWKPSWEVLHGCEAAIGTEQQRWWRRRQVCKERRETEIEIKMERYRKRETGRQTDP